MLPLRDDVPAQRYPLVSVLLIAANVLVFLHETVLSRHELHLFFLTYGVVPASFTGALPDSPLVQFSTGPLSLFTSLFLHGGLMHLVGNMWYLWIFGDNVEDRMGHFRFLAFYLLGGLAANGAQIFSNPASTTPGVGASGAIAAVLGAYLFLYPGARIITLVPIFIIFPIIELPAVLVLGAWFIMQLFSGLGSLTVDTLQSQGGIAYWAHIGGFVFGMVALPFFRERRRSPWTHDGDLPWPYR